MISLPRPWATIARAALFLFAVGSGCGDDGEVATGGGGGGTTAATTTATVSSSSGSSGCTPGEQMACYTGPQGTEGVGPCVGGTAVCGEDGTPGMCQGEVIPTTDHCRTPEDEDCSGTPAACTGDHLWSKRFGDGSQQNGLGIATDASDNLLVFGSYSGTLDFGSAPLNGTGAFVAKLDRDGNHLWSKSFVTTSVPPTPRAIATDRYDNVIFIGDFSSSADFGGGPLVSSAGSQDVFVVKLDGNGNHLWSRRFGDDAFQLGWGVVTDAEGDIIITGEHNGSIDFGGGPLTAGPGVPAVFLAKLDEDGNHLWSKGFSGGTIQYVRDVTTDPNKNVVLTGYFFGPMDLGGGPLVSAGAADIFVAKLDASGNHVWSKRFGSASGEGSHGVAADPDGNIAVVGSSFGAIDLGGGPLTNAGDEDLFVAKLDGDGNHLWSHTFGDAAKQRALAVATDPAGCVVVNGIFQGTIDFGGAPLVSAGEDDGYVVKLGLDGEYLWSRQLGDAERQFGYGVTTDRDSNVIVTGDLRLSMDFGGGPLTSAGDYDIFLAKYAP